MEEKLTRDMEATWKDFVVKAYVKEENIIYKDFKPNSVNAINVTVVEITERGAVTITQGYITSFQKFVTADNIVRIYLAAFEIAEIAKLVKAAKEEKTA